MSPGEERNRRFQYFKSLLKPKLFPALILSILLLYAMLLVPWVIPDMVKRDIAFFDAIKDKQSHFYASIGFFIIIVIGVLSIFLPDNEE